MPDIRDYYCQYCGAKLVIVQSWEAKYYDIETGEKIERHYHRYKCPNKGGLSAVLGISEHSDFLDAPSGSAYF